MRFEQSGFLNFGRSDPMNSSFRHASPEELRIALRGARDYTLRLFDCLAAAGFDDAGNVPLLSIINPPLWELGHTAWFAEWYILREARSSAPDAVRHPCLLPKGDAWFDSNTVAHDARWTLDLPAVGEIKAYCSEVLERVLEKLNAVRADDAGLYPYRLALAHEDMHGEAFAYTLQTLGVAPPVFDGQLVSSAMQGDICFEGGSVEIGGKINSGFVFDNEKWMHVRELMPFSISGTLVSNAQYCRFVDEGGYREERFWSEDGWAWSKQRQLLAPATWTRSDGQWQCRRFDRDIALPPTEPVRHLTLYEAQAYCAWAGRRLPMEAEWECAARSDHPAFQWGQLWEWTASRFEPYDGFAADAYREYSAPWFGNHQVLRGASFATPARLHSPAFRNFYLPQRNDIFNGFRTCAL